MKFDYERKQLEMTRDEIKKSLQDLLGFTSPDNQAKASEILTALSDEYERVSTESETNASRVAELTANNETLRSVNAKLFLKVGATEKEADKESVPDETETKGELDGLTFEKLFNDKGDLL